MTDKSDQPPPREDPGAPAADLHEDSFTLLRSVRRTLAQLLKQVETGDFGALKITLGQTAELERSLRLAIETEVKFTEWKAQYERTLSEHEIDFEAVRFEIGCRLARIRECCSEGDVPEGAVGG